MASEEDEELEDIDEELARVERQIQELDRKAGEAPAPEDREPEAEDLDVPRPEEVLEGDPEIEEHEGRLEQLLGRLRTLREKKEEKEQAAEDEETEEAEEEDGGGLAFWRSGSEEEDQGEPPDEADTVEPEEEPGSQTEGESDLEPPSEPEDAAEPPPEEATGDDEEPTFEPSPEDPSQEGEDEASDEAGVFGSLVDRFASDDEPASGDARLEAAHHASRRPAGEPPPVPAHASEQAVPALGTPEEDEGTRASALLARFQGGSGGPEEPPAGAAEDEEDDDGGLLVPIVVAVLLLAGAVAGAWYVLQGSGGGELEADVLADTFTNDEGSFVATAGEPIAFDASGSKGSIESYAWSFGDDTDRSTSEPSVEHTYEERGTYTVEVTVQGSGSEATTSLQVVVLDPPTAQPEILLDGQPVAEASTLGNNVFLGDQVTLDGSGSAADPEHTLTSYSWDLDGDGEPEATGSTAELGFEEKGAWTVELTVKDDLGNEASATRVVHVSERLRFEDTIGPSTTEAATNNHSLPVERARLDAEPIQLELELNYSASGDGTGDLPLQPSVDPDLDLNVTDPGGEVFQAEDDDGEGRETLTVEAADLSNVGQWTANVQQDNQNAGTASEVEYELVVRVLY